MHSIEDYLQPHSLPTFIASYYGQGVLHISGRTRDLYSSLLSLAEIDRYINEYALVFPQVRLVSTGAELDPSRYSYFLTGSDGTSSPQYIAKDKLYDYFNQGYTLVFDSFHRCSSSIQGLVRRWEYDFRCAAQANLYLTPAQSTGFKAHWDSHDVFILQVHGSKSWRVSQTRSKLPYRGERLSGEWNFDRDSHNVVLEAGDLLYIPRGFVHEAQSNQEMSLHITLGVFPKNHSDLLHELVTSIKNDEYFRRGLPLGRSLTTSEVEGFLDAVKVRLTASAVEDAIKVFQRRFTESRLPNVAGRLLTIDSVASIEVTSSLEKMPGLAVSVNAASDHVYLECSSKQIRFPRHAMDALMYVTNHQKFCAADISTCLDMESTLLICRVLVREGVLRLAS